MTDKTKQLKLASKIVYIIQLIFLFSSILFALGLIIFWFAFKNDFLCVICVVTWAITLIVGLILYAIKTNIDYKIIEIELEKRQELLKQI